VCRQRQRVNMAADKVNATCLASLGRADAQVISKGLCVAECVMRISRSAVGQHNNVMSVLSTNDVSRYHCRFHPSALQWRRQLSERARSFRGQKILQPGHPDALFFPQKKLTTFLVVTIKTHSANAVSPSK